MGGQNIVLSLQNSKKIPLVNETPGVSQQIRFLRCVTSVIYIYFAVGLMIKIKEHVDTAPQSDDIAMMMFRYNGKIV